MSTELLRSLAQAGLRVFDKEDLIKSAISLGLKESYVPRMTSLMVEKGDMVSLYKGIYALPTELLAGGPLHSFEIAMKLAKKGAISHRSAMSYYELTDQVFSKVYLTVPKEEGANLSKIKDYEIKGTRYHLLRVSSQNYWGVKAVFIGEAKVWMTNLEKTLIDGLSRPDLCGGFREVIFAYERGISKVSVGVVLDYAKRTSLVACKRLGWIFEQLGVQEDVQEQLMELPMPYCQRLDASGDRHGKVIPKWNLLENI